mmetsp:Transcript_14541/g.22932  ORF Transcript_14541/g.22932 Transcript_14541/m.22932 type:complete len:102 (-) Transcript_14541:961-1266(-)
MCLGSGKGKPPKTISCAGLEAVEMTTTCLVSSATPPPYTAHSLWSRLERSGPDSASPLTQYTAASCPGGIGILTSAPGPIFSSYMNEGHKSETPSITCSFS